MERSAKRKAISLSTDADRPKKKLKVPVRTPAACNICFSLLHHCRGISCGARCMVERGHGKRLQVKEEEGIFAMRQP